MSCDSFLFTSGECILCFCVVFYLDRLQTIAHSLRAANIILQNTMQLSENLIECRQHISVGLFDWIQIQQCLNNIEIDLGQCHVVGVTR